MSDNVHVKEVRAQEKQQFLQRQRGLVVTVESTTTCLTPSLIDVGRNLRDLRIEHGLSIRSLAEMSGLNVNTLSMIENGKSSPSVSTLQQLASALTIPITDFFETDIIKNNVSYQKAGQRLQAAFAHGTLADLGAGLTLRGGQPPLVTLEPKANSGPTPIVHTGHEFVFCLEGRLSYTIEDSNYILDPGDSLLFEAHLPHFWQNVGESTSQSLLIMCPADESDHPTERHFKPE
jgi:transcriptional regulator with XRE-family HTH domain